MYEMRKRFDEIVKYRNDEKCWVECLYCPCRQECQNLPEGKYNCDDMFFFYITIGKNFDLRLDKLTRMWYNNRVIKRRKEREK